VSVIISFEAVEAGGLAPFGDAEIMLFGGFSEPAMAHDIS
jgi:hypothetical protein